MKFPLHLLLAILLAAACHRHRRTVAQPAPPAPPSLPPPAPRAPVPPRRAVSRVPVNQSPSPAPATPRPTAPPLTPPPLLVPTLTESEREAARVATEAAIQRTQVVLARARRFLLTPAQQSSVERIRGFLRQAAAAQGSDPAAARDAAERAATLAQDLDNGLPRE